MHIGEEQPIIQVPEPIRRKREQAPEPQEVPVPEKEPVNG